MEKLVAGDVVVLEFPFSNMVESKRRPSLIIKVPEGDDLIVLQITAKSYKDSVETPLKDSDFKKGSLNRRSFIRLDKITTIKRTRIKYKIGSLKKEKFENILHKFIEFIS